MRLFVLLTALRLLQVRNIIILCIC